MFQVRYNYLYITALILYSFFNIIVLNGDRLYSVRLPAGILFLVISFLCTGIWLSNLLIEKNIERLSTKIHPLIIQFGASIVFLIIISVVSVFLTSYFIGEPFNFIQRNLVLTAAFNFRINLFLNSINAVYFFNRKFREKELEAERYKSASLAARFESLNSQVNPHFLFNNLNTLSTLIYQDQERAISFLDKLSDIYRYILKNRKEELVLLRNEIEFVKSYLNLLNERFQKTLVTHIDINSDVNKLMIPPTVLQLVIENVFKHNELSVDKPLLLNIYTKSTQLVVENTLSKKEKSESSSGIGLKNISERYKFFDKEITCEKRNGKYVVELPLIDAHK